MPDMDDALATLRDFLGDERLTNPDAMNDTWVVSPFQDAWLARPRKGSRGGHLFLVRGDLVEPLQLARTNLDEAYERLLNRSNA